MRILKEAKSERTFNPFTDKGWVEILKGSEAPKDQMTEDYLKEDKFKDIEVGTCFKREGHPSVYRITEIDSTSGLVIFKAYDHKYGNDWETDFDTLQGYFDDGTFRIVSQQELDDLYKYKE